MDDAGYLDGLRRIAGHPLPLPLAIVAVATLDGARMRRNWGGAGIAGWSTVRDEAEEWKRRLEWVERVRHAVRTRHFSPRTERSYAGWVGRFLDFHGPRRLEELGEPEVAAFLTSLAVDGNVSASTQNQALGAILFLYRHVLGVRFEWLTEIVRAKRPERLPTVLSLPGSSSLSKGIWGHLRAPSPRSGPAPSSRAGPGRSIAEISGGGVGLPLVLGVSCGPPLPRPELPSSVPFACTRNRRAARRTRGGRGARASEARELSHSPTFLRPLDRLGRDGAGDRDADGSPLSGPPYPPGHSRRLR